jgi:anthranilate phosphoribosyltransferase
MYNTILNDKNSREPYETFYKLNIGLSIDEFEAQKAMLEILNEKDLQKKRYLLAMLLNGIMIKGPSVSEVKGLINASLFLDFKLKKQKITLPDNELLVGVAGSGKKGFKTINITTPATFVAAACGAYVAKACSHSTSSKTGSSDFLELVGMNINIPFSKKVEILKNKKISFFSIEDSTPKLADVYGGIFYAPHAMSFALAGLSFPIQIDTLVYGLSHPNVKLSLEVYREYGFKNVLVYSSSEDGVHFLDELSTSGRVNIVGMKNCKVGQTVSANIVDEFPFLLNSNFKELSEKKYPIDNVKCSLRVLRGTGIKSHTEAICLNAAPIILVAGKVNSLKEGYLLAKKNIENGKVFKLFLEVVELYGGDKNKIYKIID